METTKHKVGRVLLTITLIIAFLGCMLMAITLPFLRTVGVASADSSNGVVEDNLLYESDFNGLFGSTTSFVDLSDYWRLGGAGSNNNRIFSYKTLNCSVADTNGYYANIRQDISDLERNTNITFRVQSTSHTYNWLVQLWYYTSATGSPTQGYSSGYVNADYISATFTLPSNYTYIYFIIQTRGTLVLDYCKLEYGDTFTGYVPKDYTNYGYEQGVEYGTVYGYTQYNSFINNLNVGSYSSTGGFEFDAITGGDNNIEVLQAQKVENHTRTGTEGVSTIYDGLEAGVNYNLIYTQGTFTSSSSTGTGGYYGIIANITDSMGYYNRIPAGTPFQIYLRSGRACYYGLSTYRSPAFEFAFVDINGNFIRYTSSDYEGLNNYFLNGQYVVPGNDSLEGSVLGISLTSGSSAWCRLPYDIAGIFVASEHNVGDYYHAYNIELRYLPSSDYSSGYEAGFEDGESSINTDQYYDYGFRQGYSQGHTDGVAEHTNYSFLGLISAVVDAPIKAFSGLLEFDILGVNLKNFVLGLLTLAVIIIIIKIALGGK